MRRSVVKTQRELSAGANFFKKPGTLFEHIKESKKHAGMDFIITFPHVFIYYLPDDAVRQTFILPDCSGSFIFLIAKISLSFLWAAPFP